MVAASSACFLALTERRTGFPGHRTGHMSRWWRGRSDACTPGEPLAGADATGRPGRVGGDAVGRGRADGPALVRERSGAYEAGSTRGGSTDGGPARDGAPDAGSDVSNAARVAFATLDAGLEQLAAIDLAELDKDELRSLLRRTQRRINRLTSIRALASAEFEARAIEEAPPGRENAAQQGARQGLGGEMGLPPGETKRSAETGKRLRDGGSGSGSGSGAGDGQGSGSDAGSDSGSDSGSGTASSETRKAFERGDISEGHAAVITDVLHQLPEEIREEVERTLLDAARTNDPVSLGRIARRLLAEADPERAREREKNQHRRRYASVTQTDDGAVRLSGRLFGVQGEKLMAAFHAFRRPDAHEESRTPGQRGADAIEAMADAALKVSEAPTQHGERPHVLVIVEWSALAQMAGIAELGFTGPVTLEEVRPLLVDASFSRVVLGPDSVPLEAGEKVRTVPAGLWRTVVARDRGCSWEACDAPPGWCQVAHGNVAYRHEGRLKPDNAALLCSRHHRRFDAGGWRMTVQQGAVVYEREDPRPPPGGGGASGSGGGSPRRSGSSPSHGGDPPGRGGGGADPPPSSGGPPGRHGAHRGTSTAGESDTHALGDVPLPFDAA